MQGGNSAEPGSRSTQHPEHGTNFPTLKVSICAEGIDMQGRITGVIKELLGCYFPHPSQTVVLARCSLLSPLETKVHREPDSCSLSLFLFLVRWCLLTSFHESCNLIFLAFTHWESVKVQKQRLDLVLPGLLTGLREGSPLPKSTALMILTFCLTGSPLTKCYLAFLKKVILCVKDIFNFFSYCLNCKEEGVHGIKCSRRKKYQMRIYL